MSSRIHVGEPTTSSGTLRYDDEQTAPYGWFCREGGAGNVAGTQSRQLESFA